MKSEPLIHGPCVVLAIMLGGIAPARAQKGLTDLQKIYFDQSHCLVLPEIRTDKDKPSSCYCRDAIADARYLYFTYVLPGKDNNLTGTFLTLQTHAEEECGEKPDVVHKAVTANDWKWDGPEVVRTYPPDDAIKRIKPRGRLRLVPYTVQLVYRDAQGRVTRTEEYASHEFIPVLPEKP